MINDADKQEEQIIHIPENLACEAASYCVKITMELSEREAQGAGHSVYLAWQAGQLILEASNEPEGTMIEQSLGDEIIEETYTLH